MYSFLNQKHARFGEPCADTGEYGVQLESETFFIERLERGSLFITWPLPI